MTDIKTFTDEQLLEQIKNGNEFAENEIFERYKDLVTKISRGYFIVGGDLEDTIQEGMLGLYKAIKNYTTGKEASFKTFAILCIKHQIQTAIKKANTNKNKPLSSAISFQELQENKFSESLDFIPIELVFETTPAEKAIDKENYEILQEKIKEALSALEIQVLKFYLQGYSYKEISQKLSITSKSIDNSLMRIKTKLRQLLKN